MERRQRRGEERREAAGPDLFHPVLALRLQHAALFVALVLELPYALVKLADLSASKHRGSTSQIIHHDPDGDWWPSHFFRM